MFLLDEVDKTGKDARGDPAAALLEVLDSEQNGAFVDTYLGVPVDLSKIVFIATANAAAEIPPPLLDRMEVVNLSGYTLEEKLGISERHLVPKALAEHGIDSDQLIFPPAALRILIEGHTREAGVRQLAQSLAAVCRHVAVRLVAEREQARAAAGGPLEEREIQPSGMAAPPGGFDGSSPFSFSSSAAGASSSKFGASLQHGRIGGSNNNTRVNDTRGVFTPPGGPGAANSSSNSNDARNSNDDGFMAGFNSNSSSASFFLPGDKMLPGVKSGFSPWVNQSNGRFAYPQNIPIAPGSNEYNQNDTSTSTFRTPMDISSATQQQQQNPQQQPRWFLTWLGRQKNNAGPQAPSMQTEHGGSTSTTLTSGATNWEQSHDHTSTTSASSGAIINPLPLPSSSSSSSSPQPCSSPVLRLLGPGSMGLLHPHPSMETSSKERTNPQTITTTTSLANNPQNMDNSNQIQFLKNQNIDPGTPTPSSAALVVNVPYAVPSTGLHLPIVVDDALIEDVLGPRRYLGHDASQRVSSPGAAAGLVWTSAGGAVQYIECLMVGAGQNGAPGTLTLTGQLGDVLEESARIAVSWVRAHAGALGLPVGEECPARRWDVHIHLPAGGVPKDGPSAGVTLAVALVSLFAGRCVRADTALTGELTLRGLVLPVGGVKEKVLAAVAAGMRQVILPARNLRDVEAEVPIEIRSGIDLIPVERLDQVLAAAFDPPIELVPGEVGYPAARL